MVTNPNPQPGQQNPDPNRKPDPNKPVENPRRP